MKFASSIEGALTAMIATVTAGLVSIIHLYPIAFFFIISDALFGYAVSCKYGHKAFSSRKFYRTILKALVATVLISGGAIIDSLIGPVLVGFTVANAVCGLMIVQEVTSMLESTKSLFPEWAIFAAIGTRIQDKSHKYIKSLFNIQTKTDKENEI